ncbi:acyl carrier protein [Streptomyces sp. MS06]|uniref:acyl carrier protein n=1 Tax=Streptomyces sp. MS06 TaxID=3385974 RepID=UPI0039A3E38C
MQTIDAEEARTIVRESVTRIVPDADFSQVRPDERLRDVLELDSLDFLSLVEILSERTGLPIDEDDYPRLDTLDGAVAFLVERAGSR